MSLFQVRQNYSAKTDQEQMRNFILETRILTCPWGNGKGNMTRIGECKFREDAKGQDKRFMEEIQIGDHVIIPFKKEKKKNFSKCILAKIIDEPLPFHYTGFYTGKNIQGNFTILKEKKEGYEPFIVYGRRIEIIQEEMKIYGNQKKIFNQRTLAKLDKTSFNM